MKALDRFPMIALAAMMLLAACDPSVFEPEPERTQNIVATGLILSADFLELNVGVSDTLAVTATIEWKEGTTDSQTVTVLSVDVSEASVLVWSSSDPAIATVDERGIVTAVATGSTTVTVSTGDGTTAASCVVKINPRAVITYRAEIIQQNTNTLIMENLYIRAEVTEGVEEIFFQWYINTVNSYEGAIPASRIYRETSNKTTMCRLYSVERGGSYNPNPTPPKPRDHFTFCEITAPGGAIPVRTEIYACQYYIIL